MGRRDRRGKRETYFAEDHSPRRLKIGREPAPSTARTVTPKASERAPETPRVDPPSAAERALLSIETTPSGATVTIEAGPERKRIVTPKKNLDVPADQIISITVEKKGYRTLEREVTVDPDTNKRLIFMLSRSAR